MLNSPKKPHYASGHAHSGAASSSRPSVRLRRTLWFVAKNFATLCSNFFALGIHHEGTKYLYDLRRVDFPGSPIAVAGGHQQPLDRGRADDVGAQENFERARASCRPFVLRFVESEKLAVPLHLSADVDGRLVLPRVQLNHQRLQHVR
jgi:hypothetical protein